MRSGRALVATSLALVLILTAGASAADDPLAGRVAGPPVDCIPLGQGVSPQIVDQQTILYRQSGRRIWRTGPIGACPALRPDVTLIVEPFSGELCRNDRFRVLEPGAFIASGSCRLGAFTPYDRK